MITLIIERRNSNLRKVVKTVKKDGKTFKQAFWVSKGKEYTGELEASKEKVMAGKITPEFGKDKFQTFKNKDLEKLREGVKTGQYPPVSLSPNIIRGKINANPYAQVWLDAEVKSPTTGKIVRVVIRNPMFTQYRTFVKHKRVDAFIQKKMTKILDKNRKEMLTHKDERIRNAAGLIYTLIQTGQRVASKKDTKAGVYEFVDTDKKNKKGEFIKKKVFVKEVDTFALSTLQNRHVTVKGDKVRFTYYGKCAIYQDHEIKDKDMAEFYKERKLSVKKDTDVLLHPQAYADAYKKFKKDAGANTLKDLRTAVAHIDFVRIAKRKLEKVDISAMSKRERKQLVNDICTEISLKLGNKPSEVKKSYASPYHIAKLMIGEKIW